MAYDRFLIAPINSGLNTYSKPWLIPDDAFTQLQNAYCFRGRIRKRFGSTYMATTPLSSRLGITVATLGSGSASGTVPGNVFGVGQAFSIGSEIFTVQALGTPVHMLDTNIPPMTPASTAWYYTSGGSAGSFVFTGVASLDGTGVIFYPATPVMGLTVYEMGAINNQPSFAFDTQFAYEFATTGWFRSTQGVTPTWHGTDLNFFWASNWSGVTADQVVLFVSNFNVNLIVSGGATGLVTDDPIWAYSPQFSTPYVPGWNPYSYSPDAVINFENAQPITVTQTLGTNTPGDTIASYIESALIVLPFKDRLIMLNTIENNAAGATPYDKTNHGTRISTGITPENYLTSTSTQYVNRCRFSINGSPFAANAWLQPKFVYYTFNYSISAYQVFYSTGAGYIDAPTEEAIVSAEFIKDRLIVYFQESTWELVYTGNQVQPFVWQKINTELGAEGTFSIVPFDKVVLGIGNVGVHACSGANVERIDNNIPDEIFEIKDKNEGVQRVAGIRDYYTEMVYWTFPASNQEESEVYPTRILVFNYKTGAWALNDDCITAFGYFEQQTDTTWASANTTWENANFTWDSGIIQAQFRQIIAGNQQGWVFIINPDADRNAGVMQISQVTYTAGPPPVITLTIINHTLNNNDYIYIENAVGIPNLNGNIYQINLIRNMSNQADINNVTLVLPNANLTPGGTYEGGGTAARVSNIQIQSKQLNPYVDKGRNVYLAKIDFCVEKTTAGEITVNYSPSSSDLLMIEESENTLSNLGTNVLETFPYLLYPLEKTQERLWHTVYFQTEGEFIQFKMYFSDAEIRNPAIATSPFEIEGMMWHTMPTSNRLQ